MYKNLFIAFMGVLLLLAGWSSYSRPVQTGGASFTVQSGNLILKFDGLYLQTSAGRVNLPAFSTPVSPITDKVWVGQSTMADGRSITAMATVLANRYTVSLKAIPNFDITGWGLSVDSNQDEYYTGLMERVVDGPQQASWAPGIMSAMNLRGQKIDMIAKPTTSVYAPFYLSSRGYAIFVKGTWPGVFDFASENKQRVQISFEGPSFEMSVYADSNPAVLVRDHAMDAGPPVLPPKWMYGPWRWRDEHTQRTTYYDGTPVTGPFNSEVMEDVLMMQAYGIPNSVYWIDRPWGPGPMGYDDFKIDEQRLPNFSRMIQWLDSRNSKTMLWIAPFFQGEMATEAQAKKYTLASQVRPANGNNYPMVDLTNPEAKAYWQDGVAKLLKMGVAGFKLDRSEENIPEIGPDKVFDQRSIRENRNAYPAMYVQAAAEISRKYRGDNFIVMPRAAYTGSSAYGVFWGGDIGGTQEGLRASIIAVQRAAIMGYPNWGSDTCGYNQQLMEQEVCGRWLEFSAFTPIMEVGPTRNVAFWNAPRPPEYDDVLIAIWRLYARLHQSLADYSYRLAQEAHRTGMPIVRPIFLADPNNPEAWKNWWTYMYGPDIVVSPIWEKGVTTQSVYLPSGERWRDAWNPDKSYKGGQTIMVRAAAHQMPLFIRDGSSIKLGDLNKDWMDSVAIAKTKPDLKTLDAGVKSWFNKN